MRVSPSVSVIIPVYNVESYLEACIESILACSSSLLEIIIVDDGSTDKCPEICEEYNSKDRRIKVIHKANGGLSDARNVGLRASSGDYVLFVDSDDWINHHTLEILITGIKTGIYDVDMVFLEATKVYPNGVREPMADGYKIESIDQKPKDEFMNHISSLPKFPGSSCTKMVRRQLILEHELYFQKGIYSEDIDWMIRVLVAAESFAYCPSEYYFYRQNRPGSITSVPNPKRLKDLLNIIKRYSSKDILDKPYQKYINAFMAYEFIVALLLYSQLSKREQKLFAKSIETQSWVLKYGRVWKVKLVRYCSLVFGLGVTSKLLKLFRYSSEQIIPKLLNITKKTRRFSGTDDFSFLDATGVNQIMSESGEHR